MLSFEVLTIKKNEMNAKEFLKSRRIVTEVNGVEKDLETGKGLEELLEDYHQEKLKLLNLACVKNWVATKDEQPPADTNIITRSMYGNVKDNNLMKGNKLDAHWFPYWVLNVKPPCL